MKAGEHGVIATEGRGSIPITRSKTKGWGLSLSFCFDVVVEESNVSLPPPVADEGRRTWRDSDQRERSDSLTPAPKEMAPLWGFFFWQ